jgi:hypothetical protein
MRLTEIRKHEFEAIERLIANARALVSVIADPDEVYVQRLQAWANIAEDFLVRVEVMERSK